MQSIDNQIKNKIKQNRRGKIFFGEDFAKFGSPNAIRVALHRMVKEGLLIRVAFGIYYFPKHDTDLYGYIFKDKPSIDDIARAIAKRDKCRIVPTASHALNMLGLSTQVPMNVVYITDGAPRRIKVGEGRGILFKHTSDLKRLSFKSQKMMLIVSALREIGEGRITDEEKEVIKKHLETISKKELETDIKLIPVWIRKLLFSL
jgi:predicted transcriptional regulator of viral defense system